MRSKIPVESVFVVSNAVFPPGRKRLTVASGTTEPVESITVPVSRPETCTKRVPEVRNRIASTRLVFDMFNVAGAWSGNRQVTKSNIPNLGACMPNKLVHLSCFSMCGPRHHTLLQAPISIYELSGSLCHYRAF